jgi:hypothetical protein
MFQVHTVDEILKIAKRDTSLMALVNFAVTTDDVFLQFTTLLKLAHVSTLNTSPVMIITDEETVDRLFRRMEGDRGLEVKCKDDAILYMEDAIATEEVAIYFIGNYFWDEFSKLVGKCLSMFPEEQRFSVKEKLQESASVYGSNYEKYMKKRK